MVSNVLPVQVGSAFDIHLRLLVPEEIEKVLHKGWELKDPELLDFHDRLFDILLLELLFE